MCLVSLQAIINALIYYLFVVKQEITALLLQPTTVTGKLVVSDIKKREGRAYLINSPDLIIPFIVTFSNRPSLDTTKKKLVIFSSLLFIVMIFNVRPISLAFF